MRHLSLNFLQPFSSPLVGVSAHTLTRNVRSAYLAVYFVSRQLSTSHISRDQFRRSDFGSQPYTGSYEPGLPTSGPLASTSPVGVPRITPKMLKQHLDEFVVGQDRAKKVLSVAVYNHYVRVQELQRRQEEENEIFARKARREAFDSQMGEDEFSSNRPNFDPSGLRYESDDSSSIVDSSPLSLEKSNILLLGPSGVGKTLMAKTMARVLSVPFTMSDCTAFTQAGYIGEDAEICVHRLLAAANYDVAQAENGIICLDEVDKIATAKVSHGKDVSGEGVQQALLKIIEGTTVQVQAKPERNSSRPGGSSFMPQSPGSGKPEVYNVRTDNILFIFSGAFVGLKKIIMNRISRGSIGFGQPVRSSSNSSSASTANDLIPILPGSEEEFLYKRHLPFFTPGIGERSGENLGFFNALDLLTPADLQAYGFIPELVGRIPTTTALSQLTHSLLLRILTEPRNSLVAQYTTLFSLSGIELRFTTPALHKIAENALNMSTGARALRTEMELILGNAMFDAPGSSVKFVLITEAVAARKEMAIYFGRGLSGKFHGLISAEESAWEEKQMRIKGEQAYTFEQWRAKNSGSGT